MDFEISVFWCAVIRFLYMTSNWFNIDNLTPVASQKMDSENMTPPVTDLNDTTLPQESSVNTEEEPKISSTYHLDKKELQAELQK